MDSVSVEDAPVDSAATGQVEPSLDRYRRLRVGIDVVAFLLVPIMLLGVFSFPEATRRAAVLSYRDPTITTAFTAHFVHFTGSHLIGNMLAFLLLGTVAYGLSVVADHRRLFWTATITFLMTFPFALSVLNLIFPRDAIGYGFSGVNMAFFGYIAVVLPLAIDDRTGLNASRYTPAVFLLSVGYIGLIALPMSTTSALLAGGAIVAALPYGRHVDGYTARCALRAAKRLLNQPGVGELVAVAVVVLVVYPIVGFPAQSATGLQINLYVHFLGYALAFLVVHVSLLLDATVLPWRTASELTTREPAR